MYFFPLFERECLQIFVARKNIPVTTCTKLYYVASCMLHLFSYTVKVKFPLSGPESIPFPPNRGTLIKQHFITMIDCFMYRESLEKVKDLSPL